MQGHQRSMGLDLHALQDMAAINSSSHLIFMHEEVDDANQLHCHLLHATISSSQSVQGLMHPANAGWAHHLLEYWAGTGKLPKLQ